MSLEITGFYFDHLSNLVGGFIVEDLLGVVFGDFVTGSVTWLVTQLVKSYCATSLDIDLETYPKHLPLPKTQ